MAAAKTADAFDLEKRLGPNAFLTVHVLQLVSLSGV